MNWLAENALPIWVGGAVALTMAFIVYLQTRTNGALLGIVAVIVVTAALAAGRADAGNAARGGRADAVRAGRHGRSERCAGRARLSRADGRTLSFATTSKR